MKDKAGACDQAKAPDDIHIKAITGFPAPKFDDTAFGVAGGLSDQEIEQKIRAIAPRITIEDIEANIDSEHYFTAYQGACMATSDPVPGELSLLTFCVIMLRNRTKIVGINYGPVCAANFDAEDGRRYARENAIEQIWPLMGYALRERIASD